MKRLGAGRTSPRRMVGGGLFWWMSWALGALWFLWRVRKGTLEELAKGRTNLTDDDVSSCVETARAATVTARKVGVPLGIVLPLVGQQDQ